MNKKTIFSFVLLIFLFNIIYAEENGGELIGKQNDCISLTQECADCTYVKLTTVTIPNMSKISIQTNMVQDSTSFSYNFCNTSQIGDYVYCTLGDVGGTDTVVCKDFKISYTGENTEDTNQISILGQGLFAILFLAVGFGFPKEKWKIRGAFFLFSLLMAIITMNSIRVTSSNSPILNTMSDTTLILGGAIVLFMFLYLLTYLFIEIITKMKNKREARWESPQGA